MRIYLGYLMLAASAAWPVQAADDEANLRMVWFTSHVCPTKLEPGTAGSSPETAIAIDDFDELREDAANAKDPPEGKPVQLSQYECKWVQLDGFLTWTNYYHYRGNFYADAWTRYGTPRVRYIVERFRDTSVRRAALVNRQLTLVGRFYDLCAAADRAEQEAGETWGMIFGPCHYGANSGMMLTDVIVKQVHDGAPQYLLGEGNRDLIGALPAVAAADRAPLEAGVRAWAASVQRGPAKYAQDTLTENPARKNWTKKERREYADRIADPDGYAAALTSNDAFRRLNVAGASVAVFWDGKSEATQRTAAWGCICLKAQCTDRWPLTSWDAETSLGDAACTRLTRDGDGATARWHWE